MTSKIMNNHIDYDNIRVDSIDKVTSPNVPTKPLSIMDALSEIRDIEKKLLTVKDKASTLHSKLYHPWQEVEKSYENIENQDVVDIPKEVTLPEAIKTVVDSMDRTVKEVTEYVDQIDDIIY